MILFISDIVSGGVVLAALLLRYQYRVDVRQDSTIRDCEAAQQLVELFVAAHGELNVALDVGRDDTSLQGCPHGVQVGSFALNLHISVANIQTTVHLQFPFLVLLLLRTISQNIGG